MNASLVLDHNAMVLGRLPPDAAATLGQICAPESPADLAVACLGFAGVLCVGCGALELANSARAAGRPADPRFDSRRAQILRECAESVVPVLCSTAFTLWWFRTVFPLRWGFPAPVAPMSFGAGVADVLLWLLNFEVFGYATHVLIHRRTFCGVRLPLYEWVHQPHHRYRQPTAFCAQAITGLEGIYFAATSVLVSLVFPTSHAVQFGLGSFMLLWSIAAHDSEGWLDGGFHYEHHNHPDCNFGFLGFMDVLCGTMYTGEKHDCRGSGVRPAYMRNYLGRLHRCLHGEEEGGKRGKGGKDR